jgi:long-chain alkane monooxygenase
MKKFHLAWFMSARPQGWGENGPDIWAGRDLDARRWQSGEFLIDMARSLERAGFDYIMLDDHVVLNEGEQFIEPRLDPIALLPLLAANTSRLGLISTGSTTFYHPVVLSRLYATIDHLSGGRAGWNIVTTTESAAAPLIGLDALPPHDERYDRAEEFVEIAKAYWDSWAEDAVVEDLGTFRYADLGRIREVDYRGRFFSSRGRANVARTPQGRPTICQAGSSPRGMDFAAKHADTIVYSSFGRNQPEVLKAYRDEVRKRAASFGRDPDSCKVLFVVSPTVAETTELARQAEAMRYRLSDQSIALALTWFTTYSDHDFFQYELDEPLPPLDVSTMTEGYRGMLQAFIDLGDGGTRTLREMLEQRRVASLDFVGTPSEVADQMEETMDLIGGDGYLVHAQPLTRRYLTEITEGLVPELQRRGLTRIDYTYPTLRQNLMEF